MSRIKKIKEQNPNLDVSLIDIIAHADPSDSYKYLQFLIKKIKDIPNDVLIDKVLKSLFGNDFQLLKKFEDHCRANRIVKNDITQYNSFEEIKEQVLLGDEIVKQKELEKQVIKIYSDNNFLVLIPLTFETCKLYGANTKWCITQKQHWDTYFNEYYFIFIIDKIKNSKHAIALKNTNKTTDIQVYNDRDSLVNFFTIDLPDNLFLIIRKEITKNRYQPVYEYLGDNKILTKSDGIIELKNATPQQVKSFLNVFKKHLNSDFIKKLENIILQTKPVEKKVSQEPKNKSDVSDYVKILKYLDYKDYKQSLESYGGEYNIEIDFEELYKEIKDQPF